MFAGLKLAFPASVFRRCVRCSYLLPPSLISHIFPCDPRGRSHYSSCHSRQRNEAATAALCPNLRQRRRRQSAESRRLISPPLPSHLRSFGMRAALKARESFAVSQSSTLIIAYNTSKCKRSRSPLDPSRKAQSRRAKMKWTTGGRRAG